MGGFVLYGLAIFSDFFSSQILFSENKITHFSSEKRSENQKRVHLNLCRVCGRICFIWSDQPMNSGDHLLKQLKSPSGGRFFLGKGAEKKMREKYGLLPNLPRTPPPRVWSFFQKKLTPIFFVENFIYNGQNKF